MRDLTTTIAAIRAAAAKATPRPWVRTHPEDEDRARIMSSNRIIRFICRLGIDDGVSTHDGDLIILAANHVVELCDEVERLRAIVEPLERMLCGERRFGCGVVEIARPIHGDTVNIHASTKLGPPTDGWQVKWGVGRSWHKAPTLAEALRAAVEQSTGGKDGQ